MCSVPEFEIKQQRGAVSRFCLQRGSQVSSCLRGATTRCWHLRASPRPTIPHAQERTSKERRIARSAWGGLSPRRHIEAASCLEVSLSIWANLHNGVEQAILSISHESLEFSRSFWRQSLRRPRGGASELETDRSRELRGVDPHCRSFASKLRLLIPRKVLAYSGLGEGPRVD